MKLNQKYLEVLDNLSEEVFNQIMKTSAKNCNIEKETYGDYQKRLMYWLTINPEISKYLSGFRSKANFQKKDELLKEQFGVGYMISLLTKKIIDYQIKLEIDDEIIIPDETMLSMLNLDEKYDYIESLYIANTKEYKIWEKSLYDSNFVMIERYFLAKKVINIIHKKHPELVDLQSELKIMIQNDPLQLAHFIQKNANILSKVIEKVYCVNGEENSKKCLKLSSF